jgi:hypothetical protein
MCNQPDPPPANDPMPVHISELDRGRAAATLDQMAQSIANYEASAEVTTFTSKFDAVQAGKEQLTPQEQLGYELFRGKAQCNNCHRDGGPGEDPLFTDFTASNIGTPANPLLPYYVEQRPDAHGYAANPAGSAYVERCRLSQHVPTAQPALQRRCALGAAHRREPGALSSVDIAQCGQAAISILRLFQEHEVDRAFLRHARRPAALRRERPRRGLHVLACA